MNQNNTLQLLGGGPGSGCNPRVGKCGRKKKLLYQKYVKRVRHAFDDSMVIPYSKWSKQKPSDFINVNKDGSADLYHATSKEALTQIMKQGLDPTRIDKTYLKEEGEPFTFFTSNPQQALAFGKVLLKIHVPKSLLEQFEFNLGEFIRAPVKIPAKYIQVTTLKKESQKVI